MDKRFLVLNILGLLGVFTMNYPAAALPLKGKTPGEIADLYPTLFTPAGLTFSIWSVGYLLLMVWAFFGIYSARTGETIAWKRLRA